MSIPDTSNPIDLFRAWFEEASADERITEPSAMTLATVDASGAPSARIVLLKDFSDEGFVFYTNLTSPKAQQLQANPAAALCFHWMPLNRQVRVQGIVQPVTNEEADAYFASRPRDSRIGAWASKQSQALSRRLELETRVARYALKFGVGEVPRPPFWSGFRLVPTRIEFWLKQPYRLHDRKSFSRTEGGAWEAMRLYP